MTIYTKFGSPVEIIGAEEDEDYNVLWVNCKKKDGTTVEWAVYDLRADNGIQEISDEIKRVRAKNAQSEGEAE